MRPLQKSLWASMLELPDPQAQPYPPLGGGGGPPSAASSSQHTHHTPHELHLVLAAPPAATGLRGARGATSEAAAADAAAATSGVGSDSGGGSGGSGSGLPGDLAARPIPGELASRHQFIGLCAAMWSAARQHASSLLGHSSGGTTGRADAGASLAAPSFDAATRAAATDWDGMLPTRSAIDFELFTQVLRDGV